MDVFSIKIDNTKLGDDIIIRPLPNIKDLNNSILSHKLHYSDIGGWQYKYMFFALIYTDTDKEPEYKAFYCGNGIYRHIKSQSERLIQARENPMISPLSRYALKVTIKEPKIINGITLLDYDCEIVVDDKYSFSSDERKSYIKELLESSSIDLKSEIESQKEMLKNRTITYKITETKIVEKTITLGEVFEKEKNSKPILS